MLRVSIATILFLVSAPLAAAAYKCEVDGKVTFSDRPCGENQQEVEVRTHQPSGPTWDYEGARDDQRRHIEGARLERQVARSEARIRQLQRQRDAEMAALRRSQGYSTNSLAGATRDQSIAQQMQAVSSNYETQIATERSRLQDLRSQLRDHRNREE